MNLQSPIAGMPLINSIESRNQNTAPFQDHDGLGNQVVSFSTNQHQNQGNFLNGQDDEQTTFINTQSMLHNRKIENMKDIGFIVRCQAILAIKRCLNSKVRQINEQFFINTAKLTKKSIQKMQKRKIYLMKAAQNLSNAIKMLFFINQSYCKEISLENIAKYAQQRWEQKNRKINNKIYQQYLFSRDLTRITQKDEQHQDLNELQTNEIFKEKYKIITDRSADSSASRFVDYVEQKKYPSKYQHFKKKSKIISIKPIKCNERPQFSSNKQQTLFVFMSKNQENIPHALNPLKPLQKPLVQVNDYSGNIDNNFWASKYSQSRCKDTNQFKQQRSLSESNKGLSNASNVSTLTASTKKEEYPTTFFGSQAVNFKNSLVKQREIFNRNSQVNHNGQSQEEFFTTKKLDKSQCNKQQRHVIVQKQTKQNSKKLIIISNKSSRLNRENQQKIRQQQIPTSRQKNQIHQNPNNHFGRQKSSTYVTNQNLDRQIDNNSAPGRLQNQNLTNETSKFKCKLIATPLQIKSSQSQINKKAHSIESCFNIPYHRNPLIQKQSDRKAKNMFKDSYNEELLGNVRMSLENIRNNFDKQNQQFLTNITYNDKYRHVNCKQNTQNTLEISNHSSNIRNFNTLQNNYINDISMQFTIQQTPKRKWRNNSFQPHSMNFSPKKYLSMNKQSHHSYSRNYQSIQKQESAKFRNSGKKTQVWKNTLVTLRNQQVSIGEFEQLVNLQQFQQLGLSLQQENSNYKFRESDRRKGTTGAKIQDNYVPEWQIKEYMAVPSFLGNQNEHHLKNVII